MTAKSFGCRRRAGGGPASGRTTRLATVNWLAVPTQPLPRLYECLQPPSRTDSTVRRAYVLVQHLLSFLQCGVKTAPVFCFFGTQAQSNTVFYRSVGVGVGKVTTYACFDLTIRYARPRGSTLRCGQAIPYFYNVYSIILVWVCATTHVVVPSELSRLGTGTKQVYLHLPTYSYKNNMYLSSICNIQPPTHLASYILPIYYSIISIPT